MPASSPRPTFEVSLKLDGQAGEGPATLFKFELEYGGVFRLQGIPEDQIHPVVMIECPRILFSVRTPYRRRRRAQRRLPAAVPRSDRLRRPVSAKGRRGRRPRAALPRAA